MEVLRLVMVVRICLSIYIIIIHVLLEKFLLFDLA